MRILIVRLGALGDIVHALPVVAALRAAISGVTIDWLVDVRHAPLLDLVPSVDHCLVLRARTARAWLAVIREARSRRYDVALDLQGLLKSAVLARACGADRLVGFARAHLREPLARVLYSEARAPDPAARHVIDKNLSLLLALGVTTSEWTFPIRIPPASVAAQIRRDLALARDAPFAVLNPGGGWPNKRWPADKFGALAAELGDRLAISSAVVWGPGEEELAQEVVGASRGAARLAPATGIPELVAIVREAAVVVSNDTGPLHLATAVGTPVVGIFGPTVPERNGPWSPQDVVVSRSDRCACHHRRRCEAPIWCLADVTTEEVSDAVGRRLAVATGHASHG